MFLKGLGFISPVTSHKQSSSLRFLKSRNLQRTLLPCKAVIDMTQLRNIVFILFFCIATHYCFVKFFIALCGTYNIVTGST